MNQYYPLLSIEAARSYEKSVLGDDPEKTAFAMERAGEAIGAALLNDYQEIQNWPEYPEIMVLAGKGLNTGDAFVACSLIREVVPGLSVTVVMTEEESAFNPIAAAALVALKEAMEEDLRLLDLETYLATDPDPMDIVIDGVYGHGFRPPLNPEVTELLRHVNSRTDILLRAAIDLPSGLGAESDQGAFLADFTYVPGVAKEVVFEPANASTCGRIRFLEIPPFLDQPVEDGQVNFVISPNSYKLLNRLRESATDKRDYGHCLVLAGSKQMPGAAMMASMGALQVGAGLVTALSPSTVATQNAGALPEVMWHPLPVTHEGGFDVQTVRTVALASSRASAMLIGPGLVLDRSTVFVLCRVIRETTLPLVLDASALTQDIVASVLGRSRDAGPVILTPHRGEYGRLLGKKTEGIPAEELIRFSRKNRVVTVLKGSPTRISDGECHFIAPVGGPVLARGGTGDILAGMMTALLAQSPHDPLSAAIQAVTWHGAAADALARDRGAIAVKTTEMLPYLSPTLRA